MKYRDQEPQLPCPEPEDSLKQRKWIIVKAISCCFYAVCTGFTDSSADPLLPYIQEWYKLDYALVSTLFVCKCVGSVTASFLNTSLTSRIGVGKTLALGPFLQLVGYTLLPPALPFAVFDIAYTTIELKRRHTGFGVVLQFAQANAFISHRPNPSHVRVLACYKAYD
ncbi:hypothetical protein M422DRAFT_271650 [Sphaerobolus stellatus SS14]|uniref:Autophagy-related protein n=1 Tax=Sphaerobolus stellatus (strain SS14) TaxID=990650 RepID=A0A0C9TZI1_SPHS4|nr:hypothetical protein M422DRAFT_271650 [Sphaerobolus stellatus SS14]